MTKRVTWAALFILASGVSAWAQDAEPSLIETILGAILLPAETQEARVLGVPEEDLQTIFTTARERKLPSYTIREIFVESNEAIREHGPIDNFGAFVQARLGQGLRGRDLSDAIRAEHARRGDQSADAPGKSDDRGEHKGGGR